VNRRKKKSRKKLLERTWGGTARTKNWNAAKFFTGGKNMTTSNEEKALEQVESRRLPDKEGRVPLPVGKKKKERVEKMGDIATSRRTQRDRQEKNHAEFLRFKRI